MLSLKTILLSLAVICVAHASVAEPIYVNLLPNGNEKEKIEVPLQAAELSPTIKDMLVDSEAVTKKMRTDKIKHYVDLPINHSDKRTLSAIANALMAMQNLKQKNKEYRFGPMKSIVKDFCFPTSKPATSTDLLNFLLLANFLDIGDLLRPTAAAWVDLKQKEVSLKKITEPQLNTMIRQKPIPKELLLLFKDYVSWLNNPTSLIRQIGRPIAVGRSAQNLAVIGNKLYVANTDEGSISVIDSATDQVIGNPIAVGRRPFALAVVGNKLYVANSQDNTLSVIDSATDQVIGNPIGGMRSFALAVVGNKLYVANSDDNTLLVIDSATNQVVGDPIAVGEGPSHFAVVGNKLYTAQTNATISVIDSATDQVIGDPIAVGGHPSNLAVVGNKLYVAVVGKGILVINPATDKILGTFAATVRYPSDMAVAGNKVYVTESTENKIIWVIDVTKLEVIGTPIKVEHRPVALAVRGNKLYVSSPTSNAKISVFDLEMFNYYNYTPDR